MDEQKKSYERKKKLEEEAVAIAAQKYDYFLETVLLLVASGLSKEEKLAKLSEQVEKLKVFNRTFSDKFTNKAYKMFSEETLLLIGAKKKITAAQKKEIQNLQAQLESDLNRRLAIYEENAKKLILKEELKALRELEFGFKEGGKISKKDLLFYDSRGRVVKNKTIMAITVGDSIWNAIFVSVATSAVINGVKKGIHVSVLDDRTTQICIELDGEIRDLQKDQLPPMHINCRSDIILLINKSKK